MRPEISIIVPIYNVELYLHDCLDSLLAQTFTNFELILVNDGSTDKSGQICEEYREKDERIKVIHKENGGVSSARNRGLEYAQGNYIGFIDPDDTVELNMYEVLLRTSTNHKTDIVVCPYKTINLITNMVTISNTWKETHCVIHKKDIEAYIIPDLLNSRYNSLLSCCNKLYRKTLFDEYNLKFDENRFHGEDARLNILLLTQIRNIVFIKQPLYNYYIRPRDSLTQSFKEDLYDYIVDNKNFGIDLCIKYGRTENIKKLTNTYILSTLMHMQNTVKSNLPINKKYKILMKIMNDLNFKKHLSECQCPSFYYKLLKLICIRKNEKVFLKVVTLKNRLQPHKEI